MNIRKVLTISLISFAFFVTGCSSKDIGSVQSIADEATHQRTMTKVQNNVSEIIGKDYKYVLENMGRPYCTTYYIDIDKVKNISNIEELNSIENIRLIYPKETNVDESENSALYMQLDNYIVEEVQTYEILSKDEKEDIKSSVDIIVDRYSEEPSFSSDKFENINLDKYVGEDIELFLKDIGYITSNFEIYDNKREKNIKVYLLNQINSLNNKIMLVYNNSDKIEDIKIVKISEGLDLINDFSFFK
ncbi:MULTISPECIES: hypothetical protein [Romboutsia]|jgi:hypothetical protein|uniref:hypothetical protein n=1 Tax=Romboutsia TaxID=1501226 RepID=UPI00217375B6|nr:MULTISPECIES: hypothetical protein [Romboutsia]MCI9061685.1 hypothetical protein [Romboutsia sp.]